MRISSRSLFVGQGVDTTSPWSVQSMPLFLSISSIICASAGPLTATILRGSSLGRFFSFVTESLSFSLQVKHFVFRQLALHTFDGQNPFPNSLISLRFS